MIQHKWIIVGTPNGSGSGSQDDPYRVSDATKFDERLQALAASMVGVQLHLHLGAGTFNTLGLRHFATTGGGHSAGINKAGDKGWYVLSNWTITGAGEAATTIALEQWPTFGGAPQTSSDWAVVGCGVDQPASNVLIEHLTVDGNWENLVAPPTDVALHGAAIVCGGPVRFSRVTAIGFHSSTAPNKRCYGLCTLAVAPLIDVHDGHQAAFDGCTVHGGIGDDCAGIGAIQYGPSIISNCTAFSLANSRSGAIEVIGRDIILTNNFVWDCHQAFHADTGSLVGLQMDNNRFICTGRRVLYAESTVVANEQRVWINVRRGHWEGSSVPANNVSLHGVYVDIPIRPLADNPQYRIRVWFSRLGSDTGAPPAPAVGILVKCPFTLPDYLVMNGETLNGATPEHLESQIHYWLNSYYYQPPTSLPLTTASMDRGAVLVVPTANSERIYDSQAGPFTSDESKVYLQFDENIRRDWRIRNNYFELPFKPAPAFVDQSFIHFVGNGLTDKDYHFSNNLGRFIGDYPPFGGIPTYSVRTKGIEGVTVMDNVFDAETERYGQAEFLKPETPPNPPLPIDNLTKRGNRNLYEKPIQMLLDDYHDWGAQQTLSLNNGYPLPGTVRFSDPANGVLTGIGVDLREELRPGDLLASDGLGYLRVAPQAGLQDQAYGPFYVQAVNGSTGTATLARTVPADFANRALVTLRRYRGPMAYQSEAGGGLFNVTNDGSMAIGGLPANFGSFDSRDFYVNGKATFQRDNLGESTVPGMLLVNPTEAGEFVQQHSPALEWGGRGWAESSQTVHFRAYVMPVVPSGGGDSDGLWVLESSINGVPTGHPLTVGVDGSLSVTADIHALGAISAASFSGGDSQFGVISSGNFRSTQGGSPTNPAYSFSATLDAGIYHPASNALGLVAGQIEGARVTTTGLQLGTGSLAFGTSTSAADTYLVRDEANTLAQRNGNLAQTFRVYATYGSSLNYSRLTFKAQAGGNFLIRSEAGGTGTLRTVQVGTGPRSGANQTGVDTIIHGGLGTGSAPGGAILFQYSPAGSAGSSLNNLTTAWQIGGSGHLMAYDPTKMIKWGAYYNSPAIKAVSGTNPELHIRRGDDSGGAALLYRLSVAERATNYPILESDSNRTFTNEGAGGAVIFTLPSAYSTNIGFHCHFAVAVGQPFEIKASGSARIRIGSQQTTQGGSITTSALGNTIHLVCTQTDKWVALSHEGTWSGVS